MQEIYKELLYREIGRIAVELIRDINFDELVNKASIRALKRIEDIITDDNIPQEVKAPYIEEIMLKYGLQVSDNYD